MSLAIDRPAGLAPPVPLIGRLTASVLLAVAASLWVFAAPGYWVFTATFGVILAVSTVGLMVVVGWIGEISLAHAGLTATAVYVCAWADRPGSRLDSGNGLGLPFLAAAALGIGVVVLLSVLVALATARLSGIYIMVLTLALQTTIQQTVFTWRRMVAVGAEVAASRPSLLGVKLNSDESFYLFCLFVLGVLVLLLVRLRNSRFGRGLVLVGTDHQVAAAVGVSPWRAKISAFAIAGFCAGVAGALTAPLYTTPPGAISYMEVNSLFYLAIPVLAGFRSFLAVAAVAVTFIIVPQALEQFHVSPITLGAIGLFFGTLAGRGGMSGLVLDQVHAWNRARRGGGPPVDVRTMSEVARGVQREDREQERQSAMATLRDYFPHQEHDGDLLVAQDVSVSFGGVVALQDASITVPAGQFVGLLGPNGAGKTTLFDVINGLRTPDSGRVFLAGEDITSLRPWERAAHGLSRTFQANRVNLDLSVAENLLSGAYTMIPGNVVESVLGMPRPRNGARRAEEASWAIAELLNIKHHWDMPTRVLSYGNRRRVEIGRTLMSGPRVLLLDEPAAGLDPTAAAALFNTITGLQQDLGLTILLVEHHVQTVLEHCSLIYVLGQGAVIASGTPEEIGSHPEVRASYLGPDFQTRLLR